MQHEADQARCAGHTLALVPTMGSLHAGHLALVRRARQEAEHITVSIFVNPTQFGPNEDFEAYPRILDQDLDTLREIGGVEAVFAPSVKEMYPSKLVTWVTVEGLTDELCGAFRPGHFQGVTTVVSKLFLACRPDLAVFGLKDAQQFLVLQRMVRDLNFGIRLIGAATVREPDGLALSSRNQYLTPEEREQAVVVSEAVALARQMILGGERDARRVTAAMKAHVETRPLARVQYAEVVDTERIAPISVLEAGQEVLAAVAVFFGDTRLIDNAFVLTPDIEPLARTT